MNYIRKINDRFIEDLKFNELKVLFDAVKGRNELQFEIRRNYIAVYYRGGRIIKIVQMSRRYAFDFDKKYLPDNDEDRNFIAGLKDDASKWAGAIDEIERIMNAYFAKNPNPERDIQQKICKANVDPDDDYFIVDMEWQMGQKARADMLGLHRTESGVNVVLIELKQKQGAVSGKAGLSKHHGDFVYLADNNRDDLIGSARGIYANKVALGLIDKTFDLTQINDIEILFLLYDYNERSKTLLNELNKIKNSALKDRKFAYIKMPQGSYKIKERDRIFYTPEN